MASRISKLILGALIFALVCSAQLDTATIVGTVLDASGAPIPSASVIVQNQLTGITWTVKANDLGNFVVPVLPIGRYRVTASAPGFKSRTVEDFTLRVSDRLRVEIALETGSINERITVTAESPMVEAASTTLGG